MLHLDPYLNFPGTTEEVMIFYQSVLGGQFAIFQRYKDTPGGEKMNESDQEKMLHISLKLENGITIMATDFLESMGQQLEPGNNFHLCIQAESEKEVDKLFAALSAGGSVEMPVNKTFWGAYFGMCRDKYGIQWMINFDLNKK
ncbi:MAG: VOC family protein [Bacteroidota bacterium]